MDTQDKIKAAVSREIAAHQQQLSELSRKIHANPEPGFHEVRAAEWLSGYLEENGFSVERGVSELPTAFRASYGQGKPVIAFLAEYDALPGIGHGCGHNIIAACACGAGIASRQSADRYGGTIQVIGTPAEEIYGGKAIMVEKGAFKNVDAAMMVHPGTRDTAITRALACQTLEIEFSGKAAHAAASPEKGINALEAMLQSFAAINSLRQHIKSTARIHGIITDGGEAANIVPAHSAGNFIVRAEANDYLEGLKERVLNCFSGAAMATGATLEYRWGERYAPMRNNLTLARLFTRNMESLGRKFSLAIGESDFGFGSTDMGNVSQVVPGLHAFVAIAPPEVLLHSPEFAFAAASETGTEGMLDAARALAMTATELLAHPELVSEIKELHRKSD